MAKKISRQNSAFGQLVQNPVQLFQGLDELVEAQIGRQHAANRDTADNRQKA